MSNPYKPATGHIAESNHQHLDAMMNLFKSGQTPHHEKFPDVFGSADNHEQIKQYLSSFFKPKNPFRTRMNFAMGWFIDNELQGYLLYHLYESSNVFFGKTRWNCFVEDIVVSADHRSLGGASMLLAHLVEETKTREGCVVSATVWNGNEASEALFQKYGFSDLSKTFYRIEK